MADAERHALAARQGIATAAFVELVNALVDDFDVVDVLTGLTARCVELLPVDAAGILLADSQGTLRVIGASNEHAQLLELLQVQNDEGPCLDCHQTGRVVVHADLTSPSPWPRFATASVERGYRSVCAIPLRIKHSTMGCLNLFKTEPAPLTDDEIALAQGLADVATITIAQNQIIEEGAVRERQLQHALDSRTVIEQAKGMISAQRSVDMDAAFAWLRGHARSHNRLLTDTAKAVIAGTLVAGTNRSPIPRPSTSPQSRTERP